jgi:hypothetical protein
MRSSDRQLSWDFMVMVEFLSPAATPTSNPVASRVNLFRQMLMPSDTRHDFRGCFAIRCIAAERPCSLSIKRPPGSMGATHARTKFSKSTFTWQVGEASASLASFVCSPARREMPPAQRPTCRQRGYELVNHAGSSARDPPWRPSCEF